MLQWFERWWKRDDETAPEGDPPHAGGLELLAGDAQRPALPVGLDTRGLLGQALEERALLEAWERVRDNKGAPGVDGQDIHAFGQNVFGRLQQLRSEVLKGSYQPQPLKRVSLAKPQGGFRYLAIPAVRDRVLQTAVAMALKPLLDKTFEEVSYGYRPGRSVAQAIARVARHRDNGLLWLLEADIENFFDSIHHATLCQQLARQVPDAGVQAIVALWLAAIVQDGDRRWLQVRGVPQGSPLSPLLANLYLDTFDERVMAQFAGLVRYADDFVVLVQSPEQAQQAQRLVQETLGSLRLRVSPRKTRITSFDQGFAFLGVRFRGRLMEPMEPDAAAWVLPDRQDDRAAARHEAAQAVRALAAGRAPDSPPPELPRSDAPAEAPAGRPLDALLDDAHNNDDASAPALPGTEDSALVRLSAEPVAAPLLQSVYVGEPGTWLSKQGERLLVTRDREVLASVPLGQVDQIAVLANAMVSTALLRHCAQARIAVYLGDPAGGPSTHLDRGGLPDLQLFELQHRRHGDAAFNTQLARAFVEGKLHASKLMLRRFTRREGRERMDPLIARIDECLSRLPSAPDCATVRGLEGAAAKAYFEGLRLLVPTGLGFGGRRRRPPTDGVNALLSFGYAVLASNMQALARLEGLNVHFGALHSTAPGSQALVSDLMEEFRAPVVDAVVLTQLRDGSIGPLDFEHDPGAELPCRLKPEARRVFVKALEQKLESRFIHPRHKRVVDFRRAMQHQIQHYVRVLRRDEPVYLPLKLK